MFRDSSRVILIVRGSLGCMMGMEEAKQQSFVAENLHLKIFEMLDTTSEDKAKEAACKAGYLKTDEQFLKQGLDSGVCCVSALIEGREMVVSNLGDCRAICMPEQRILEEAFHWKGQRTSSERRSQSSLNRISTS